MVTMMACDEEAPEARGMHGKPTPARHTTTLYDLMTAIQEVVGPDDDRLVVATVVHLLQSGRLTWRGKARTCLEQAQHAEMRARQHGSPRAALKQCNGEKTSVCRAVATAQWLWRAQG
jgi:hypothetical protein